MARGGVHLAPYDIVLAMLHWARTYWTFIDGHHLSVGVNLESYSAYRLMNVIDNHYVNELLHEQEYITARDNARAKLREVYNNGAQALDGVANDENQPGLPFEGYTPQTEDGFEGLEPPMG